MYLGLCVGGAIVLAWTIAVLARPDAVRRRGRDLAAVPAPDEPGLDVVGWETPSVGLVVTDDELSGFDRLPPVLGPWLDVARPVAPPVHDWTVEPQAGGDDPWPMVA